MSADNSIARGGREADPQTAQSGFEIPPELAARYEVRIIEAAGGREQRLGLFRADDRERPAIEITDNRIVARMEDAETVASLVKIAQHNGWDRIDVEGSPEFRKAVWSAATREGLTVSGYEPSFAEAERIETLRREAAARRERETAREAPTSSQAAGSDAVRPAPNAEPGRDPAAQAPPTGARGPELSDGDRRLLLTLSRHNEDRKALFAITGGDKDAFQRDVEAERIALNRDALENALERALESPTLVKAFERSGYEPDALREMGKADAWDREVADAVYLVRSGLNRSVLAQETGTVVSLADKLAQDRDGSSVAEPMIVGRGGGSDGRAEGTSGARDAAADRRHGSDDLADIFLRGDAERIAAEPRLASALQAQTVMERHIGEVFDGDAGQMASANLESRHMISDVLRRGLDVAVREPTPVRQIEPMQVQPDLER
jgi:hypothetical protein